MKKNNNPPIRLLLNPENYNSLTSILSFFIATENLYGKTYFSHNAAVLKNKILKYSRIIKSKDSEKVSVYFYENESVNLMKLIIKYNSMSEEPSANFFAELKKQKYKNRV